MNQPIAIEMNNISFSYDHKPVLNSFNLQIKEGKLYGLVGSSGSGKTTALRLMNGLLQPSSGVVKIDGKIFDFKNGEKWRRSMGYSIQGSGLFPHLNLQENLTIIARKENWAQKDIDVRTQELCELMSLPYEKRFLTKKPREISGGQQQRLGIARALFLRPKIMLMDEPFSALDPITRSELQKEFLKLQEKLRLTIVLVTHDLSEAFSMSNEIILLNQGAIEQMGRPSNFLLSPATEYVKEFMESHSPGNILKEVFLYSVVNMNLYSSCRIGNGVTLRHLDSLQKHSFDSESATLSFLKKQGQSEQYWVTPSGEFIQQIDHQGKVSKKSILSTKHILAGMKSLLDSKNSTISVVNQQNKLIGVFNEGALDAL